MIALDYKQAHFFVDKQAAKAKDGKSKTMVRWDGWDILFWHEFDGAYSMKNGAFYNGRWGVQTRIKPNKSGIWLVSEKHVNNRRARPRPR